MTRTTERSRSDGRGSGSDASGAQWAPDFLELSAQGDPGSSFQCSTTRGGVAGGLSVIDGRLVLSQVGSTMSFRARDVLGWWDTSSGATFSLAIETGARHTLVLLSEFRGATVHAMTRAFGPRRPLNGLSA